MCTVVALSSLRVSAFIKPNHNPAPSQGDLSESQTNKEEWNPALQSCLCSWKVIAKRFNDGAVMHFNKSDARVKQAKWDRTGSTRRQEAGKASLMSTCKHSHALLLSLLLIYYLFVGYLGSFGRFYMIINKDRKFEEPSYTKPSLNVWRSFYRATRPKSGLVFLHV